MVGPLHRAETFEWQRDRAVGCGFSDESVRSAVWAILFAVSCPLLPARWKIEQTPFATEGHSLSNDKCPRTFLFSFFLSFALIPEDLLQLQQIFHSISSACYFFIKHIS